MYTKIGIFDSGIGGVTVLKECIKLIPNFEYLYYSDSIHNPYGDSSCDDVISYCDNIVKYLISKGCYIIVIACNTASAISVNYLREKYKDIHFIAIEPAIKMAYDNGCKSTLILATKGTMDSERFRELYNKYHYDNFYLYSCIGLANLIEKGNELEIDNYIKKNLSKYYGKVSSVVLGCTHYPLVKDRISKVLHNNVFYDGSLGVAMQLKRIIKDNSFVGDKKTIINFEDSTGSVEKRKRFYIFLGGDYE